MKSFLKYLLATITGMLIVFGIAALMMFGIMAAAIKSAKPQKVQISPNSVLKLKLNYPVQDRTSNNPFENFNFKDFTHSTHMGLNDLLRTIEKAKTDNNIKGIYLDLTMIPSSFGTIEEIRNALLDFKTSGKFIMAYSEVYTQKAYYIASVADKIYMNPQGTLIFNGLQTEMAFLKDGLDKLGIDIQVVTGPGNIYKSAVEPFTQNEMSEYNKEQTSRYVNVLWSHMLDKISESRNIPTNVLNNKANEFKIHPTQELVSTGLLTGYKYKDEIINELKKDLGISDDKPVAIVQPFDYKNHKTKKNSTNDKIAVVYANGEIVPGEGDHESMGAEKISRSIRTARKDSSVKAVVLRINSGGGSALAAEIIWREVQLTAEAKTMIVSMGSYAASGGYYIACAADTILADPTTITGSIGVFGIIPNAGELLNDNLGIHFDRVKTNRHSDIFSIERPLNPEEIEILNQAITHTYNVFLTRVAEGRNMSKEAVDEISRGIIWIGIDAKRQGLVDMLGGLNKAITVAANNANIDEYKIVEYPKHKPAFQQLLKGLRSEVQTRVLEKEMGVLPFKKYTELKNILEQGHIQAKLPFKPVIY
ncbi:MAG: signal peptide peptidase SppA [Bacteroidota bacterium]